MGDDCGACRLEHRVTRHVVDMVVSVDYVPDRFGCDPTNLIQQSCRGLGIKETVDHQHAVVTYDEAGIGARPGAADGGIDAWADLFQGKGWGVGRCWRRLGRRRSR